MKGLFPTVECAILQWLNCAAGKRMSYWPAIDCKYLCPQCFLLACITHMKWWSPQTHRGFRFIQSTVLVVLLHRYNVWFCLTLCGAVRSDSDGGATCFSFEPAPISTPSDFSLFGDGIAAASGQGDTGVLHACDMTWTPTPLYSY